LNLYGGEKIPFTHFSDENIKDSAKIHKYVFPVVFAYICGILKIEDDFLLKPKALVLGKKNFDRNEVHWIS
jgi:hypothetical protein